MKKILGLFLLVLLCYPPVSGWSAKRRTFDEYNVKFSVIYRVCMFTEWPDRAELDKPFVISVLGNLPKGVTVRIPKDLTIHNRRVILRRIKRLSEIKNSRVLFIAASEAHRADDIIDYVNGRPILTVGDTQGLGYKGVIINLFIKEKRVKFEINHGASKRASLQMHSQLFAIGKVVGRDMRHEPATGEENNRKNGDAPK